MAYRVPIKKKRMVAEVLRSIVTEEEPSPTERGSVDLFKEEKNLIKQTNLPITYRCFEDKDTYLQGR